MQRADRNRGVERTRLGVEVGKRHTVDVAAAGVGVDRLDDVAARGEGGRQLALPGANLEHAARGRGQVRTRKRGHICVSHRRRLREQV
jgi:hypothetical protein